MLHIICSLLCAVLASFSNLSISSSYSCFSFFFLSSAFFALNCLYLVCILRAASSFSVQTFAFGFAGSAGLPLPAAGAAPFLAPYNLKNIPWINFEITVQTQYKALNILLKM